MGSIKFHYVAFGPGGKPISCLSISESFLVSTSQSLLGFQEFFSHLLAIFISEHKFDWSVIFSSHFKYGTFENE